VLASYGVSQRRAFPKRVSTSRASSLSTPTTAATETLGQTPTNPFWSVRGGAALPLSVWATAPVGFGRSSYLRQLENWQLDCPPASAPAALGSSLDGFAPTTTAPASSPGAGAARSASTGAPLLSRSRPQTTMASSPTCSSSASAHGAGLTLSELRRIALTPKRSSFTAPASLPSASLSEASLELRDENGSPTDSLPLDLPRNTEPIFGKRYQSIKNNTDIGIESEPLTSCLRSGASSSKLRCLSGGGSIAWLGGGKHLSFSVQSVTEGRKSQPVVGLSFRASSLSTGSILCNRRRTAPSNLARSMTEDLSTSYSRKGGSSSRTSISTYWAAHTAANASWYIPKVSDVEDPKCHDPVLSSDEVSAMVQRVTRGGDARQLRRRRLKLSKGAQKSSNNAHEPEKRSNPFVEFEDREQRLQNERRWLQEDPLYMAERYAGVKSESVQQRLKKLMTAPSDLYEFIVFYSTYAVQMNVVVIWRRHMAALKASAKGIIASKREILVGTVVAQKYDEEAGAQGLVGAVHGMTARVAGMGFAMARISEVKTKAQISLHNQAIETQAAEERGKTRHGRGHRDEKINLHAVSCKMLQQLLAESRHKLEEVSS